MDKTFLQLNKIVLFEQFSSIYFRFHGNNHEFPVRKGPCTHVIRYNSGMIFCARSWICQVHVIRL